MRLRNDPKAREKIDNSNLDFLNKEEDRRFIINKVEEAISTLGGKTKCSN